MERGNRKSHRFPPSTEWQQGVLRIGDQNYPVRVLDESAGGFGVMLDTTAPPEVDRTLVLGIHDGRHEVRVSNVREYDEGTRVGLERIGDLIGPLETSDPVANVVAPRFVQTVVSPSTIACGLLFVGLLGVVGWTWNSMQPDELADGASRQYRHVGQTTHTTMDHRRALDDPERLADQPAEASNSTGSERARMVQTLGRLRGLLEAHAVNSLELSDGQLQQLQTIMVQTTERLSGQVDAESAVKILEEAQSQMIVVLNNEQRGKWQSLSQEP